MNIVGKPSVNFIFFVLCLNRYIPAIVPMDPPSSATNSNVFSGILHFPYIAFRLSMYITNNPIKLMMHKQIDTLRGVKYTINPVEFKNFMLYLLFIIHDMFQSHLSAYCLFFHIRISSSSYFIRQIDLTDYFVTCLLSIQIF